MSKQDFTGDLDVPERKPVAEAPLAPEVMARIDRALDAIDKDWQEVECYQLGTAIISSCALHTAVEALRIHLRDPRCWENAQDTSDQPAAQAAHAEV